MVITLFDLSDGSKLIALKNAVYHGIQFWIFIYLSHIVTLCIRFVEKCLKMYYYIFFYIQTVQIARFYLISHSDPNSFQRKKTYLSTIVGLKSNS